MTNDNGKPKTSPTAPAAETLHVGCPNMGDRVVFDALVEGMFERRWFTNGGVLVQELEEALARRLGVRHCIAVCNATVGLQIACRALGLAGEVILPAFTFVATAHALEWLGIRPVFADIDPNTHNLDPGHVESLVSERTSGIVGVHVWGRPCDTEALERLADRRGLALMFDAAHAFACRHQGRGIGNFGRCEVFSFHATKCFNTFEGGAVTTNDDALAERLRRMKNFGFAGMDNVTELGINGKMPEVCAAMGLACLARLDDILAANRRHDAAYRAALAPLPGIRLIDYDAQEATNHQYIVLEVDEPAAGISRDRLLARLHARNIRARRYFYPGCHRMEPYRTLYPEQTAALPATDRLCRRVLVLPTGTALTPADVERVCEAVREEVGAPVVVD